MTNNTDAKIALLHSGLHSTDRCVVVSIGKGGTAKRLAARMIDTGWLKKVRAKPEAPIWISDKATGSDFSLRITAVGVKGISATEKPVLGIDPIAAEPGDIETDNHIEKKQSQPDVREANCVQPNFQESSKLATAVTLLRRDGGAMIGQLSAEMDLDAPFNARDADRTSQAGDLGDSPQGARRARERLRDRDGRPRSIRAGVKDTAMQKASLHRSETVAAFGADVIASQLLSRRPIDGLSLAPPAPSVQRSPWQERSLAPIVETAYAAIDEI